MRFTTSMTLREAWSGKKSLSCYLNMSLSSFSQLPSQTPTNLLHGLAGRRRRTYTSYQPPNVQSRLNITFGQVKQCIKSSTLIRNSSKKAGRRQMMFYPAGTRSKRKKQQKPSPLNVVGQHSEEDVVRLHE